MTQNREHRVDAVTKTHAPGGLAFVDAREGTELDHEIADAVEPEHRFGLTLASAPPLRRRLRRKLWFDLLGKEPETALHRLEMVDDERQRVVDLVRDPGDELSE